LNGVQDEKYHIGEDASRLSPFFIWKKTAQRKAALTPLMKERTKKIKIIIYVIAPP